MPSDLTYGQTARPFFTEKKAQLWQDQDYTEIRNSLELTATMYLHKMFLKNTGCHG